MAKNTHLTLSDRIAIEVSLRERKSFSAIAEELGKDPTTISKEIRTHIKLKQAGGYNPCVIHKDCKHYGDLCHPCKFTYGKPCHSCYQTKCFEACPDFQQLQCSKLSKPPYVCNGCQQRISCKLERHLYEAKSAQKEYEATRSESRQGFAVTSAELDRIDRIISPLIKQGQSIYQICVNNADEIMLDERTIYNYVDAGLLSVGNIDLPRKVRYKARGKKPSVRVDKQCHLGRTYEDFLEYTAANPDTPVVEIDSVEGRKGGKVLMTVFFRNSKFGEIRSRVFYRDPQRSDQKSGCEVTHEFIRRVLPKGTSFDHLQQSDILRMMSHITSYTRKKLNNQSAHRLFSFFYGETILPSLGIQEIPANDINLTPRLLKK